MTKKKSKKFEMPMDDETPEFQVQEELDDLKVEKLHKRITRISIIIPCLVVVIILVAYFDLKKKCLQCKHQRQHGGSNPFQGT